MQVNNTVHGTLYKCKGKYRIIISYYDEEGKRKQKTYSTGLTITGNKRRAEQMLDDKLQEFKGQLKGYQSLDGNCTVSEWVHKYIEHKQGKIRQSSINSYMQCYTKHIQPYFRDMTLRDVSPKLITAYLNHLNTMLSNSSVRVVLALLSGALDYAVQQEIILVNPCKCVKHHNNNTVYHPQHKRVWTDAEISKVLDAFKGKNIYEAVVVAMFYGLRRGELLGLTWDNVDFDKRLIHIRRTLNVDKTLKNYCKTESSIRTLSMPDTIYNLLIGLKEKQQERKALLGDAYIVNDYDYVFTRADGKMYTPGGFRQSYINTLDRAGLPRNRVHDLRHTAATLMFANGADVSTVQHALGHSTAGTTLNVYIHHLDNNNSVAANIMNNVMQF